MRSAVALPAVMAVVMCGMPVEAGLLYFTDFENFTPGAGNWVGTDGWQGFNTGSFGPDELAPQGIDDKIVPEQELENRIKMLVERAPEDGIILKGDEGADYGVVVHVLDLARAAGAKGIQMSADRPAEPQ